MTAPARHIALAGDSIFDNDIYVMGEPGVIEQMRKSMPRGWSALKVAVDGDCTAQVPGQVAVLPTHVTDLIVSVGGNDALKHGGLLAKVRSFGDLEQIMKGPLLAFAAEYGAMLDTIRKLPVRCTVCTIYTAIPFEEPEWRQFAPLAIGRFNEAILGEAGRRSIDVLRLDHVCTAPADFAAISPIEPSARGGQKIVDHILAHLGA